MKIFLVTRISANKSFILFLFFFWPYIVIFFICKRDSNTFSRNLDFCVFGESTNFKISDVIIDLTALLKLHSQPTFFCSKSTTETLKKVYFQNQQEKDYVTDVVLVFFQSTLNTFHTFHSVSIVYFELSVSRAFEFFLESCLIREPSLFF